jgi:lysine 6-dehydrogenase
MPSVLVLGSGLIGSYIAADLAADSGLEVTVADVSRDALGQAATLSKGKAAVVCEDVSDPSTLRSLVSKFDLVVGALPSRFGFRALRECIEAGRPMVDISFMPEDALSLDALARDKGVAAIVDCGIAPGLSNLLAARAVARLDECDRLEILVGGVPRKPTEPFRYKAPFSLQDVLEEYTRPARIVAGGCVVDAEPLADSELIDFPTVGVLEATTTDGLRSLATTLSVPNLRERTLRHPGHYTLMRAMKSAGFLSKTPMQAGGVSIAPRDLTIALLEPLWTYLPGEEDVTVMRVFAEGQKRGRRARVQWDMVDVADRKTGTSSMARTTGLTCTTFVRLLAEGAIEQTGVLPPERFGHDADLTSRVLRDLAKRGIRVDLTEDEQN